MRLLDVEAIEVKGQVGASQPSGSNKRPQLLKPLAGRDEARGGPQSQDDSVKIFTPPRVCSIVRYVEPFWALPMSRFHSGSMWPIEIAPMYLA
jgi:hypothetical protein